MAASLLPDMTSDHPEVVHRFRFLKRRTRGAPELGGKSRRATHQAGRPTKVERAAVHAHGRSGSARGYLGADSKPRAAEFGTDVAEQNQ